MRVKQLPALPHHGQAGNMKDSSTPVAGSGFATGRPATGRTHAVSVRLTAEAFELLKRQRNKSEYIDNLIKKEARSE